MIIMQVSIISVKISDKINEMSVDNQIKLSKILSKGFDNLIKIKDSIK